MDAEYEKYGGAALFGHIFLTVVRIHIARRVWKLRAILGAFVVDLEGRKR